MAREPPVLHAWLSPNRVVICAQTDGPGDLNRLLPETLTLLKDFMKNTDRIATDILTK